MEITNVIEWQDNISTPITAENLNRVNTGTKGGIDSLEMSSNTLIKEQSDRIPSIYEENKKTRAIVSETESDIAEVSKNNADSLNKLGGNKIKVVSFLPDEIDNDTLYFLYRLSDIPTNFADATPTQIKSAFETDSVPSSWQVGDTKSITLNDGNSYTLRLLDKTKGRYERKNGTRSNCVIGFDEIIQTAQMNGNITNTGGWIESKMYKETMPSILAMLPQEWREVISTVRIASTVGGTSTSISYSDNKLFLPALAEIFDSIIEEGYKDEGNEFDYYKGTGDKSSTSTIRVKKYTGSAATWWLRSPVVTSPLNFGSVNSEGSEEDNWASKAHGVSVCFAL